MKIRKLEKNDIEKYEHTLKNYIEQLMAPYTKRELKSEVQRIYDNMLKFTSDKTATIMGAFEDEIVGFIWGYRTADDYNTIHVNYFVINEANRGHHIGSQLLKNLEDEIGNFSKIELLVNKKNTGAFNFYKKHGFEIESEIDDDLKLYKLK